MKWLEKFDILDQDHEHDLERISARHEFHSGLPREQAEQLAYQEYKRQQMVKAAAYHLDGVDSAKSLGDASSAQMHHNMYQLHCNALAINPLQAVSPEIMAQRGQSAPLAKFTPHPADSFILSSK